MPRHVSWSDRQPIDKMMEQLTIKDPDNKWCPDTAKEWILFVRKIVNPLKKLCYEIHFVNDEQEYFEYVPQCLPEDSEFYNYLSKYRESKIVSNSPIRTARQPCVQLKKHSRSRIVHTKRPIHQSSLFRLKQRGNPLCITWKCQRQLCGLISVKKPEAK